MGNCTGRGARKRQGKELECFDRWDNKHEYMPHHNTTVNTGNILHLSSDIPENKELLHVCSQPRSRLCYSAKANSVSSEDIVLASPPLNMTEKYSPHDIVKGGPSRSTDSIYPRHRIDKLEGIEGSQSLCSFDDRFKHREENFILDSVQNDVVLVDLKNRDSHCSELDRDSPVANKLLYKDDVSRGDSLLELTPTKLIRQVDKEVVVSDGSSEQDQDYQRQILYNNYENFEYKNQGIELRIGKMNLVGAIVCDVDKTLDRGGGQISKRLLKASGKSIQDSYCSELDRDSPVANKLLYKDDESRGDSLLELTTTEPIRKVEKEVVVSDGSSEQDQGYQRQISYHDYENVEYKNQGIKLRIGEINLVCRKGNITDQQVDVIVCDVDKTLDLGRGQISKRLLKASGKTIQNECKSKYPNGIGDGDGAIAVVNAGKLYCQKVYFITVPKYDGYRINSLQALKSRISSCLEKADDANFKSIAMPALGLENLNYPVDLVAEATLVSVKIFSNTSTNTALRTISVVYNDGKLFEELLKQLNVKLQIVSPLNESSDCSEDLDGMLTHAVQETLSYEQVRDNELTEPFEGKWTMNDFNGGIVSRMDGRRHQQTAPKHVGNCLEEHLGEGLVPPPEDIRQCIRDNGRTSEQVLKLLEYICSIAKLKFKNLVCLWAGYESEQEYEPILVAVVKEPHLNIPEKVNTFKLIQRQYGQLSNEAKFVTDMDREIKFTEDESARLQQCLTKYTAVLMQRHSNLLVVSASKYKSKGFGTDNQGIERKVCIVLYVHIKGTIPFREEPFPKTLDEFPVDVRESLFKLDASPKDYLKNLMMGSYIESAHSKSGTLGGFVQSNDGTICALTCCHIFMPEIGSFGFNPSVYQPTAAQPNYKFGQVKDYSKFDVYENKITVDAALLSITDSDRLPSSGRFPDAESIEAGFSPDKPMLFNTGKIVRDFTDIPRVCNIVKYGATSEHTIGDLNVSSVAARGFYVAEAELHGQIEIQKRGDKEFATDGDSGSLVFCVTTTPHGEEEIRALGLYVGSFAHGPSIITPIWAVLGQLNLHKQLLSFNKAQGYSHRYVQESADDVYMECDSEGASAVSSWSSDLNKAKTEQEVVNKKLELAILDHSNVISANQKRLDRLESFQFKSGDTGRNRKPPTGLKSTPDVVPE